MSAHRSSALQRNMNRDLLSVAMSEMIFPTPKSCRFSALKTFNSSRTWTQVWERVAASGPKC